MLGRSPNGKLLLGFSLGHLANDWAPATIWLIAPAIAVSLGLSPAEVGLLITIVSVGAAFAYFPAGLIADRVANRGLLLLATFWWVAIGYFIASFAPGFWSVALLLAIAGLGDAAWHPIATGVLVQALPKRRAHALGIHAMGGTFAEVLAPLSVGFLLAVFDWRTTLLISALPAALMGLAFFRIAGSVPRSPQRAISRADIRTLWNVWRGARGLAVIAMISVYNMALMAVLAMAPLFLQQVHGFSPAQTGIAFAAMVLAGALAQPVIGRLSDRSGRKSVFVSGNLVALVGCFAAAWSPSPVAVILALVLTVGALYGIRSAVLATAVEFSGEREATTLGFVFAVLDGVGALGALLAGALGSLDLQYAFLLAAGFAAGATAIAVPLGFGPRAPEQTKPVPGPAD